MRKKCLNTSNKKKENIYDGKLGIKTQIHK